MGNAEYMGGLREPEEEGVRKDTEEKWDCQAERETRERRERLELKDLLDRLVQRELMVQPVQKETRDLLDHQVLQVLLGNFHCFLQISFSKEIHPKPTEDQREKFEEILLMEKLNHVHRKIAMLTS